MAFSVLYTCSSAARSRACASARAASSPLFFSFCCSPSNFCRLSMAFSVAAWYFFCSDCRAAFDSFNFSSAASSTRLLPPGGQHGLLRLVYMQIGGQVARVRLGTGRLFAPLLQFLLTPLKFLQAEHGLLRGGVVLLLQRLQGCLRLFQLLLGSRQPRLREARALPFPLRALL